MRILMAAGGTGGHIFPALAVAEELKRRLEVRPGIRSSSQTCSIDFLGTTRGLEARVIPASGFRLHTVSAAGLMGITGKRLTRNLFILPHTFIQTAKILEQVNPDVVLGMGGYLAGPALLEAALGE